MRNGGGVWKKKDRRNNSKIAGYGYPKYDEEKKTTTTKKKSNQTIAKEVVAGKWGNGAARKKALTEAGYDYDVIRKLVNELLKKEK